MIFAPFTGIDNHGKLVTFGAALLRGEDNKLYSWVFEKFLECMGRCPLMIITDQDPAMKIVVEDILKGTAHRLCMWHIMRKVPGKTKDLNRKDEINKRFTSTVWSISITPIEFEKEWGDIMTKFELYDERWFRDLYNIRQFWIPAYFRDTPMSGICRTTSISESVNSFFSKFLSSHSNLVEFMMHFDSAMDAQRETNDMMNSSDINPCLVFKTPMPFEKHATSIYTISTFYKVQKEIEESCRRWSIRCVQVQNEVTMFDVSDGSKELLKITYNQDLDIIECSCNKFVRDGLLCSHIFSLFKYFNWVRIPEKYIVPRWTRRVYATSHGLNVDEILGQRVELDEKKKTKVSKVISSFYTCVGNIEGDDDMLDKLVDGLSDLVAVLETPDVVSSTSARKCNLFEMFYGASKPDNVEVHPPRHVQTKGLRSCLKDRT